MAAVRGKRGSALIRNLEALHKTHLGGKGQAFRVVCHAATTTKALQVFIGMFRLITHQFDRVSNYFCFVSSICSKFFSTIFGYSRQNSELDGNFSLVRVRFDGVKPKY